MLTKAEEIFIAELVKGKSQRQAYLIAYPKSEKWKEKSFDERACNLFNSVKIKSRYQEVIKKTAERIENKCLVDVEYVINGIKAIADTGEKETDKLRAYELLGKHLKMFTDKLEVETNGDLAELLKARREKVLGRGK